MREGESVTERKSVREMCERLSVSRRCVRDREGVCEGQRV